MQITARRRAFTFLEVMVVVTILGILIAVAVPNMAGPRQKALLRGATREVTAAGLMARQLAMAQGYPTQLFIDDENGVWQVNLLPEITDRRELRRLRDGEPTRPEEQPNELHHLVKFAKVKTDFEVKDKEGRHILTFYPNGSCSGMAVMVENERGFQLTVDFDPVTGRPEIYEGEPKTMVQKLKENGLNPADYGLQDPDELVAKKGKAGEGFKRTAGMDSDERVKHYKDAIERMMERSRNRYNIEREGGPAAYYRDAQAWGQ